MKIKWLLLGALILVAVIVSLMQKPSHDAAMKDYHEHMQADAGDK